MKERRQDQESYWQVDEAIGEAILFGEPATVRLRLHVAEETYHGRHELVPLSRPPGKRVYAQAASAPATSAGRSGGYAGESADTSAARSGSRGRKRRGRRRRL